MIGINCTPPQFVEQLIAEIRAVTDLPVAVYPNSGEEYDPETKNLARKQRQHPVWRLRPEMDAGGYIRRGRLLPDSLQPCKRSSQSAGNCE